MIEQSNNYGNAEVDALVGSKVEKKIFQKVWKTGYRKLN